MNNEFSNTNLGNVVVDNEVIKNIALKAATEIDEVHKIKDPLMTKVWNFVSRRELTQGVKLEFTGTSELKIALKLVVNYGVNIPDLAGEIQEKVKKTIEYMIGLTVSEVAVKIVGIKTEKDRFTRENYEKKSERLLAESGNDEAQVTANDSKR